MENFIIEFGLALLDHLLELFEHGVHLRGQLLEVLFGLFVPLLNVVLHIDEFTAEHSKPLERSTDLGLFSLVHVKRQTVQAEQTCGLNGLETRQVGLRPFLLAEL